jgi:hypothetical protein
MVREPRGTGAAHDAKASSSRTKKARS